MIPKIIHYCWFGGNPLPELAQRCIASWRKFLPDYEIWQWNEGNQVTVIGYRLSVIENGNVNVNVNSGAVSETQPSAINHQPSADNENQDSVIGYRLSVIEDQPSAVIEDGIKLFDRVMMFDVNMIPYTAEAYRQKKYAFVSDYARFWILYQYGGIYFDTDVEVIRPMDDIIAKGNFMGFELDPDGENTPGKYAPRYCFCVNPGVGFGISQGHTFIKEMLEKYKAMEFRIPTAPWGKTIVAYTTESLMKEGLQNVKGIQHIADITIYPHEYFAPIDVITGKLHITANTYTIHWYMGSWNEKKRSLKDKIRNMLPEWVFYLHNRIKRKKYKIK